MSASPLRAFVGRLMAGAAGRGCSNHMQHAPTRRFRRPEEVEIISRIMRKWDIDDEPVPEAAALGEFVLKASSWQGPWGWLLMHGRAERLVGWWYFLAGKAISRQHGLPSTTYPMP